MLDNLKLLKAETLYVNDKVIQLWKLIYKEKNTERQNEFKEWHFKRGEVRLIRGDDKYDLIDSARILYDNDMCDAFQIVSYYDLFYKDEKGEDKVYTDTIGFSKVFKGYILYEEEELPFYLKGVKAYAYCSAEGYPENETEKEHQIKVLGVRNLEKYIISIE